MLQNTIGLPTAITRQQQGRWLEDTQAADATHKEELVEANKNTLFDRHRKDHHDFRHDLLGQMAIFAPRLAKSDDKWFPWDVTCIVDNVSDMFLLDYLASSPYSPLMLEHDPQLYNSGLLWRDAFEDLLHTKLKKACADGGRMASEGVNRGHLAEVSWIARMININKRITEQQGYQTGEWAKDLWANLLGSTWRGDFYDNAIRPSEGSEYPSASQAFARMTKPESEQSLYEQFLLRQDPTTSESEARKSQQPEDSSTVRGPAADTESVEGSRSEKVGVLSTLTTTERVVLPDGTVTTKVVLKRKFADGREECTETVHKGHVNDSSGGNQASAGSEDGDNIKMAKKRSGWFW
jgi:hypothetical protein